MLSRISRLRRGCLRAIPHLPGYFWAADSSNDVIEEVSAALELRVQLGMFLYTS